MNHCDLTLKQWIDQEGIKKVAKRLKVDESTVRHWRRGHCLPKARQMYEIKKLTQGSISYATIIDTHFKKPNKR